MIQTVRQLLGREAGRRLLAGLALVVLGLVELLRALVNARARHAGLELDTLDRTILALFSTSAAAGVPFIVGALVMTVARRRGDTVAPELASALRGAAIAVGALGLAIALAAILGALGGEFGAEDGDSVVLTGWERLAGLVEGVVAGLALTVAAVAVAGSWEAAGAAASETAPESDATVASELEAQARREALPVPGEGATPGAATAGALAAGGNGSAPGPITAPLPPAAPPEPERPASPAEARRALFEQSLRFSPSAGDARRLLDRLARDPADERAAAEFDALVRSHGSV